MTGDDPSQRIPLDRGPAVPACRPRLCRRLRPRAAVGPPRGRGPQARRHNRLTAVQLRFTRPQRSSAGGGWLGLPSRGSGRKILLFNNTAESREDSGWAGRFAGLGVSVPRRIRGGPPPPRGLALGAAGRGCPSRPSCLPPRGRRGPTRGLGNANGAGPRPRARARARPQRVRFGFGGIWGRRGVRDTCARTRSTAPRGFTARLLRRCGRLRRGATPRLLRHIRPTAARYI